MLKIKWVRSSIWIFLVLMMDLHSLEARVDEMEQAAPKYREAQPPASTPPPEPPPQVSTHRLCFNANRTSCPTGPLKCERVNPTSVLCCDVDSFRLKEGLAAAMTQNITNLHVLNATIPELDVSQAVFRRLASMAVTDGNIGTIVGQFPKYSSLACLNISNNNLKSATLQPTNARPFAYLFNLTILDASANNLTHFPLSLVHSNRNISIDLSGNDFLPCREFMSIIDSNSSSLVHYLNYNKTVCLLNLEWNWWLKSRTHVHIDHIRVSKELNASCRNIKPEGIDCTCALERRDVLEESISYQVSVDCANRKLRHLPSNLPDHTVKLNVSWNNITSLEAISDDPSYDHLRQLVLDHNEIPNIIELEGTKFIDNFMLFSIKYNKLKAIPTYVLSNKFDRNAYSSFLIAGNYIHCDCNTEKLLKPWLKENAKYILDYRGLMCENNMGSVADLIEYKVCQSPRDWTDYISIIIGLEVLTLVLLISKVSYDYWIFKTAGYLPWPANKMPRLPCDWLCE